MTSKERGIADQPAKPRANLDLPPLDHHLTQHFLQHVNYS